MNTSTFQIYVYRVKSPEAGAAARNRALQSLRTYAGFKQWQALVDENDPSKFSDYLEWANPEAAKAAEVAYMEDPETADFQKCVEEVLYAGNNKLICAIGA